MGAVEDAGLARRGHFVEALKADAVLGGTVDGVDRAGEVGQEGVV